MPVLDQTDLDNLAAAVWNEILTGATYNIKNSAGKRLRDLASNTIHFGNAQSGGVNGNQIQLAADASSTDGAYDPAMISITDGTGNGQTRLIYEYDGTTKIATVDRNWKVIPDSTSEYVITSHPGREHVNEGLVRGGTINTVTLNALASPIDNVYNYQTIFLRSGTGEDQTGQIISYDGSTKIATIEGEWAVIPDTTTGYTLLPYHNNPIASYISSFQSVISVDMTNGMAGTIYPQGTPFQPVNNLSDAFIIANRYGLIEFNISGIATFLATDNLDNKKISGKNTINSIANLTEGVSTDKTSFSNLIITGVLNGSAFMDRVALQDLTNVGSNTFPSVFNECIFRTGIAISLNENVSIENTLVFLNCTSTNLDPNATIINMNNSITPMSFEKFTGGITIKNFTGGQTISFDMNGGTVILDPSCTNGTVVIRGNYTLINNSTLTVDEGVNGIMNKYLTNKMSIDTTTRAPQTYLQIWNDAGTAILYEHRLLNALGDDPVVDNTAISNRGERLIL